MAVMGDQMLDVIVEPRFDTIFVPAAGLLNATFFAQPLGAGATAWAAAGTKTIADTNMTLSGQLPTGYNFVVLGFRLQPYFGMLALDAPLWGMGATFTFFIGSKNYLQVPVDTIPGGNGPVSSTGLAAAGFYIATNGQPRLDNNYGIGKKPLELAQNVNFGATITWPVLSPITSDHGANHRPAAGMAVRCYLDGYLKRIVQ